MDKPFNLYELYGRLGQEGVIFCFSGPISQAIVEGIGETIRQKMELEEADLNTTQKVFSVFVEQMQNVLNYSQERTARTGNREPDLRLGILLVGQENERFYVACGNKIDRELIASLRERLEPLKSMDRDQLKTLYKEYRKAGPVAGSKGGGLGFIDMARKACRPIDYEFIPVDEKSSFFCIKVMV